MAELQFDCGVFGAELRGYSGSIRAADAQVPHPRIQARSEHYSAVSPDPWANQFDAFNDLTHTAGRPPATGTREYKN